MSSLLAGLNPEQREAVTATDGAVLVLAGAGSGKTRVITARIAFLIKQCGVPPEAILAVTFTNKAAQEMAGRVRALAGGKKQAGPTICTFHAFGARFLRDHAGLGGYRPNFTIFDEQDQLSLLRGLMEDAGHDMALYAPRATLWALQQAKSQGLPPASLQAPGQPPEQMMLGSLLAEYQQTLQKLNGVDFDDLLLVPNRICRAFPREAAAFMGKYRYVMVDEYQDTNRAQYELMRAMAAPHGNLCAVGDDDQSIYGWRGADPANIQDFERDFPGARLVRLERNYRSTDTILSAANQVIRNNPVRREKTLRGGQGAGQPLEWLLGEDEADELERVVTHLGRARAETGRRLSDCAILYRSNHQSRAVEGALRDAGIPYLLVGGTRFFDRREVKDALAYLKLVYNTADEVSLNRVLNFPRRGIGRVSRLRLAEIAGQRNCATFDVLGKAGQEGGFTPEAARSMEHFAALIRRFQARFREEPLGAVTRDLLQEIGFHRAVETEHKARAAQERAVALVHELELSVERFGENRAGAGLRDFLEHAALFALPMEEDDRRREMVTLMTVHAAKGLEFPLVYLVGMADDLFPHHRSLAEGSAEEERRLFYVAVTRARERLIFSMAKMRRRFGETLVQQPSRFLAEIDPTLFGGDPPSVSRAAPAVREQKAHQARARFFDQMRKLKEVVAAD